MGNIIKVQKGTKDILPSEISLWHFMEEKALEVFSNAGYKEIRTPIFEATELFASKVLGIPPFSIFLCASSNT